MDELERMGLVQTEDFFDDGRNEVLGQLEEGDDPRDYGLREVTEEELARMAQQEQQEKTRMTEEDFDLRMEERDSMLRPTKAPRGLMPSSNTGPKGVLKDYQESKHNAMINRVFDEMRRDRQLRTMATGRETFHLKQMAEDPASNRNNTKVDNTNSDSDSDDLFADDDDKLFAQERANRIAAIQATLPVYGKYARANNFDDLAKLIRTNDPYCWIVVHVYDNSNRACLWLHLAFEYLATQFKHVCFIRARPEDIMKNFAKEGLPSLLLYQGKDLKDSIISTPAHIGVEPTDREIAQFLADKGVLRVPDVGLRELTREKMRDLVDGYESENEQDETKRRVKVRASTLKMHTMDYEDSDEE